jgi:hypothetical protein
LRIIATGEVQPDNDGVVVLQPTHALDVGVLGERDPVELRDVLDRPADRERDPPVRGTGLGRLVEDDGRGRPGQRGEVLVEGVDGALRLGTGQRALLDEHAPVHEPEDPGTEHHHGPQLEDRAPPPHAEPP